MKGLGKPFNKVRTWFMMFVGWLTLVHSLCARRGRSIVCRAGSLAQLVIRSASTGRTLTHDASICDAWLSRSRRHRPTRWIRIPTVLARSSHTSGRLKHSGLTWARWVSDLAQLGRRLAVQRSTQGPEALTVRRRFGECSGLRLRLILLISSCVPSPDLSVQQSTSHRHLTRLQP